MKIFIVTEGGKKIGFGHITRCIALYEAFKECRIRSELIVNGDTTVKNLLKGKKYKIFKWLKTQKALFNILNKKDIVVIDSYLADSNFYKKVSETVRIPVYIDDNKRINYPRGVVLNGSIYAKKLRYPKKEGTIYLLGTKYTLLRKEFWHARCLKKIKKDVKSIMVTFGGDDARNITLKGLEFLIKKYPKLEKRIVIGGGFCNTKEIEKLKGNKVKLIYYPSAMDIKKMMIEVDIAISAGGQTLYECARIGVPTIAIAVADNQLNNIKEWQKIKFIQYGGWYKNRNLLKRVEKILRTLSYKKRQMMSRLGQRFIDGNGARRAIKEILTYYYSLKKEYA